MPVTKLNMQANTKHTAINPSMYGKHAITTPINANSMITVINVVM